MRFAALQNEIGRPTLVELDGLQVRPIAAGSLVEALRDGPDPAGWERGAPLELDELQPFAAPLSPPKIVAIGLNYRDHIRETGLEEPSSPLIFAKFPSCVTGPNDPVVLPAQAPEKVDWEVELAVVIGSTLRDAGPDEAMGAVFGYTVANDVSARDAQFEDVQWVRGKSFATFCPIGPSVVTPDELGDPQNLALSTRINGETVQESNTAEMIFPVADLLSYCSHCFQLDPGDVLLTGTPWGCGAWSDPPRALRAGDVMESEVEGIGLLRNPIVAA